MTLPPSYQEADSLAIFLTQEADAHAATAAALARLDNPSRAAIKDAQIRAAALRRASELMRLLAGVAPRLHELERRPTFHAKRQ